MRGSIQQRHHRDCRHRAANPNLVYPTQGATAVRPHAPTSICGTAVSYDANGNTLSYDVDGAGPEASRSLAYDLENRPLVVTRSGLASSFAYGADRLVQNIGQASGRA
jgi:hypothetical protein